MGSPRDGWLVGSALTDSPRPPSLRARPGIHENLAHARYTDTLLTRSAAALEHMSDADVLCGRAQATSTYGLLAYLPLSALAVRQLVGSDGERVPVAWPTGASNARREQASRCALTDAWRRSVAPAVRATVSGDAASQLLPFLLTILVRVRPRRCACVS